MKSKPGQKDIPKGWLPLKLRDIFSFKNGLNKEKKFFGQGTPIINYVDVYGGGGLRINNILGKVEVNKSELERFQVKKGDVFFTRTSETLDEIGLSAVALDEFKDTVFSGFVLRARPKGKLLNPGYAQYCFKTQSARKEIMEKSSYTTRALTSGTSLNHVNINLPSPPEQNRIVTVLETWDKMIEKLEKKIEIKNRIKIGLMQELLVGKTRLSRFKNKWKKTKLGDLFTERAETGFLDLPLLSIASERGIIYQSESNKKDTSNSNKSKYLRICPGDIGYNTMRMWQGRSALSELEGIVSPAYTILAPRKHVDSRYFAYLFKTPRVINFFFQKSQGLVNDTLQCRFKDFSIICLEIPSYDEQKSIANIISAADKEIAVLSQKLSLLNDRKRYLLNNLITGTIRTPETLKIKV